MAESKRSNLLTPGSICIANGECRKGELQYDNGEVLTVIYSNTKDSTYQVMKVDGSTGTVPTDAVVNRAPIPLHPMRWYHQDVTREESESLLDKSQEGQYLLRASHNNEGVYALAVSTKGCVKHYLIVLESSTHKVTIDGIKYFDTLPNLVEYYRRDTPTLQQATVVPKLIEPLLSQESIKFYVDKHQLKQNWGLNKHNLSVVKTLGKGEFGEVNAGEYRGLQVAIKSLPSDKEDGAAVQGLLQEAAIMTHLRHKNLVQMVGVVFSGLSLNSIVLELMTRGSLFKYLSTRGRSVISQAEQLGYARNICEGMTYIAREGFIHRDLAARNVLLDINGQAKISDFGLATLATIHVPREKGKFPIKWTAPEALKEGLFSEKSDVWSFGILLWEIYSFGRVPYPSILAENVLEQIEEGHNNDPPDGCPDAIYDIMTNCWDLDPNVRPTFGALQSMLSKSFGESRTPCSSPVLSRKSVAKMNQAEALLKEPIASNVYQEVPSSYVATTYFANLMVVGDKGSGKTSLIRCLQGEQFRQKEPPTVALDWGQGYCELVTNRHWRYSCQGIEYETELARAVADKLLKHVQASAANSPPLPPVRPRSSSSGNIAAQAPPLPPRMSMVIEAGSDTHLNKSAKKSVKRRFSFSKVFRRPSEKSSIRNSVSSNALEPPPSPTSPTLPEFVSSIPDHIEQKIKDNLKDCVGGALPTKVYGKLIDCPSDPSLLFLGPALLTKAAVFLVVVDVSLSNEKDSCSIDKLVSQVEHLLQCWNETFPQPLSENSLAIHTSRSPPPFQASPLLQSSQKTLAPHSNTPSVVLIGTHIDQVRGLAAKDNYERVRKRFKSSACGKYLASGSFMISCSSLLEQSVLEDLKKYLIDLIKKRCSQEIPLKWLRCVRKFQRTAAEKHICTTKDAIDIVRENFKEEKETEGVLRFLEDNNIMVHLKHVKGLQDTVITDPQWFVREVGKVFSLMHPSARNALPSPLEDDVRMLVSLGSLSNRLIDHLWPFSRQAKQELLLLLHSLEIVALKGSDSRPISPWESEASLLDAATNRPHAKKIGSVIVPSVVTEQMPPYVSSSSIIEPLYFRNSNGRFLDAVMPTVAVRCMQMYTSACYLYNNASCFQVDSDHVVVIEECSREIKVYLQQSHHTSHPTIHTPPPVAPADVAMATLMFVQATVQDICSKWTPEDKISTCVKCNCARERHYITLGDNLTTDRSYQCELGSKVKLTALILPWFGEDVSVQQENDAAINQSDVEIVAEALSGSWEAFGAALGFSEEDLHRARSSDFQEATKLLLHGWCGTFLDLITGLEKIGRSDISDNLIDSRMKTSGVAL